MEKQLLIYERAVPVTVERHSSIYVKSGVDYGFAREVNSVPLVAAEFAFTAQEYAIVFTGEDAVMPAVILGMRDSQNVFVDDEGRWKADYLPAFIRRYPFVVSSADEGETLTLCLDENFSGCNDEGRGERLFDAEGERTAYLEQVVAFARDYQGQFQRTQMFCQKLKELDLLTPMQANFRPQGGEALSLTGFFGVDRERVKALDGEKLKELATTDELELIYLHLHSLRNLSKMVERVGNGVEGNGAPLGEAAPAQPSGTEATAPEEPEKVH